MCRFCTYRLITKRHNRAVDGIRRASGHGVCQIKCRPLFPSERCDNGYGICADPSSFRRLKWVRQWLVLVNCSKCLNLSHQGRRALFCDARKEHVLEHRRRRVHASCTCVEVRNCRSSHWGRRRLHNGRVRAEVHAIAYFLCAASWSGDACGVRTPCAALMPPSVAGTWRGSSCRNFCSAST